MNKPAQTPDLLGPVKEALTKLTPKEIRSLAVDLNVDPSTLRFIVTPRPSSVFGPSYKLVAALYERLVVKAEKV